MATINSNYELIPDASGATVLEIPQPLSTVKVELVDNVIFSIDDQENGEFLILILKQDATGGRTVTWGSEFKFAGGISPAITTAANGLDQITFSVDGTDLIEHSRSLDIK